MVNTKDETMPADPEKKEGEEEKPEAVPNKAKKGKAEDKDDELSEEDQAIKDNLDLMVERTKDVEQGIQANALQAIATEIKSATTSMTSVPKPLKFLRTHYAGLKATFEAMSRTSANRAALADVLSVLAMNSGAEGARESLRFRLAGSHETVGSWGHEYVRHLAGEIGTEWQERVDADQSTDDLLELIQQIVPFHMAHNAEPEAVDMLLEVEQLPLLVEYVDDNNYRRTCLYLVSTCSYLPPPDDQTVLKQAFDLYLKFKAYPDALHVALRAGDRQLQETAFTSCEDFLQQQQLCHILARQGVVLDLEEGPAAVADEEQRAVLQAIMSNNRASERYLALARDLDVMAPRTPEEVYKSHLVETRSISGPALDSARANLANTFVNAFVNAGFGQDKLMTVTPESESSSGDNVHWIFKNKDHGKTSATASLGMITLWDVEGGLPQLDKYLYSNDPAVVAGALLGVGIVNTNVRDEYDPAFALLSEHVNAADSGERLGAIMGLGLAYAGTRREEVRDLLTPLVTDSDVNIEISGNAALALGLVFCGACEEQCVGVALQALMTRGDLELEQPAAKFLVLGLGLLFLGRQDSVDATLEVAKTFSDRISQYAQVVIEALAFAGTGDVLRVQQLLSIAGEHIEVEDSSQWKAAHQTAAVLGIALVSVTEELGREMAHRAMEHLLQYGEPFVRRGVPLAVAMLNISNPTLGAMDMLSRLSHDSDVEVGQSAILSLGLIGAGTNNARLAGMLRSLSSYYYKEPTMLFLVRVAQGLVHTGKGLLTLSPTHAHGNLLHGPALGGILAVLTAAQDMKATIGGKHHTLLYFLAAALQPRMLMTIDEEGTMLPVPVRVGQAVDVVAQAGRPKTITGFQTHTTPVLLSAGERAELGTDKYVALSPALDGIVILKKNPNYVEVPE